MKKLLIALVACVFIGSTSVSLAVSETDIAVKKTQLSTVVKLILNSSDYTAVQKDAVRTLIKNCAKETKNEVVRGACELMIDEIQTPQETKEKLNKEIEELEVIIKEIKHEYSLSKAPAQYWKLYNFIYTDKEENLEMREELRSKLHQSGKELTAKKQQLKELQEE